MATQTEVRDQIGTAFAAWVTANLTGVPIAWDDREFDPATADKSVGYVRFTLLFAGGSQASLGASHFRDVATVIVQTFADIEDVGRSDVLAESCKNFLRSLPQGAAGIRVIDPGVVTVGPDRGVWYQQNATATLTFDSHV